MVMTKDRICCYRARDVFESCSPLEQWFWYCTGAAICSTMSLCYYLGPLSVGVIAILLVLYPERPVSWVLAGLEAALILLPANRNVRIAQSKLYRSVAYYFDTEVYYENPKDLRIADHPKPILYLCFPHGIVSLGGWSMASLVDLPLCWTAAADAVLRVPFLRHISGVFGITSGSRGNLRRRLRDDKHSILLYPGGLAELFLSDPDTETLYFNHRKGCVKVALESGADIKIVYLFGNTQMYRIFCSQLAAQLSRLLKVSITIFWGRWGTLLPYKTKVITAMSDTIEIPDYSTKPSEINNQIIEHHHEIIKRKIFELFDKYKTLHPSYAHRHLKMI